MNLFATLKSLRPAPSGLPSAGSIILRSWDNYLRNFKPLMRVALLALAAFPFTLPQAMVSTSGIGASGELMPVDNAVLAGNLRMYLPLMAMTVIATLIVLVITRPALNATVYAQLLGKKLATGDAVRFAVSVLKRYVPAMLLAGIVIGAGFTLWRIPGIIALVFLMFTEQAAVLEDAPILKTIRRSFELVRGRFWAVLWRMLAANAVFGLASIFLTIVLIQMPLTALGRMYAADPSPNKFIIVPFLLIGAIIGAVAQPLALSAQVILFTELKKLKK